MIIERIARSSRAAAAAGWNAWARDAALGSTTGFADAWEITDGVPGWLHEVNAAIFWGVIAELAPTTVVEIGSYQGRSTVVLGQALKHFGTSQARITAIDPHTGDRQHLEQLGLDRLPSLDLFTLHVAGAGIADVVDMRVATSDEVATDWDGLIDVLYVDGWHAYDAVRADALNFGKHLSTHGVVCFDDYVKYEEVRKAVDESCAELGLHLYGTTLSQAWAGVTTTPPRAVAAVLRLEALKNPRSSLRRGHAVEPERARR